MSVSRTLRINNIERFTSAGRTIEHSAANIYLNDSFDGGTIIIVDIEGSKKTAARIKLNAEQSKALREFFAGKDEVEVLR